MAKKVTIEDLAEMTKSGFDAVDKRFDEVDKRFEQVDGRLLHIDARLDTIEHDVKDIRHDVSDIRENMVYREEFDAAIGRIVVLERKCGVGERRI